MMNFSNNPYLTGVSGILPAQQRLMQMEAQYPQFAQPQAPQIVTPPTQPIINASFVTNLQEAQAQPVGINTTNVAIDNTNNKIYLKRMDNNGLSATKTYIPQEDTPCPVGEFNPSEGVDTLKTDLTNIKNEVSGLKDMFHKSIVNLSVDIENIINNAVETQMKKLKGEKSAK